MSNIPSTEYIAVNKDGIFVGGKIAMRYCGQEILYPESIKNKFKGIRNKYPNIKEFRFLASETQGKSLESGTPVAKHGPNGWACFEFTDGFVSPWVMMLSGTSYSMDYTAGSGLNDCFNKFNLNSDVFLQPVLGPYRDVYIRLNLQNTTNSLFEANGYRIRITVEKIARHER